jgi:hypothetical protein
MCGRVVEPTHAATLRRMSIVRRGATLLALVCACGGALAKDKDDPYCAPLAQAITAAVSGDAFAGVTGADAGLYHEATLVLPEAKLCTTNPREKPAAWRCHVETNDRYTLALELHGDTLRRIEACLGDAWSTERIQDKGYLRLEVLTRGDDAPRVQLVTTVGPKYRLLVTVFAQ